MSTPIRLLSSPRSIIRVRHLTPTRSLLTPSSKEPWTPGSLCSLDNTSALRRQCTPTSKVVNSQLANARNADNFSEVHVKAKGVRRLPWSDGGKCAHNYSRHKQEIFAEPLPSLLLTPEKNSEALQYPTVNTPNRKEVLEKVQSGQKVQNLLGKGTFGTVFEAIYHGNFVAVKIPSPHPKALQQFSNECHAIKLQHPNIVPILKAVSPTCDLSGILIMEHVLGYSLQKLLDLGSDLKINKRRFKYSLQIAKALEYCHKQLILHLDVKPKNVLVHHVLDICKLCDFGCSSVIGDEVLSVQGTVQYTAPEILKGETPTAAADVYSLAITMWQLMSGESPYSGEGEHSIIYKVAAKGHRPIIPEVETIDDDFYFSLVQMCWSQAPQCRLKIEQVVKKLDSWLGSNL